MQKKVSYENNPQKYNHNKNEEKWIRQWAESGIYKTPADVNKKNKYYILPQLPYPSGSGLHVGHAEVYSACDILARFKRMKGEKVLQVIGWDAFGLPAENFAIKTNIHPRINTDKAIDNFRDQIQKMGVSVDWDREVGSHNPGYYKWTQWFFLLMYNQGLAYRKNQKVNWCPSCKTVLANEQVITKDGKDVCERCDTEIEFKMMEQWYLKITDYADRLHKDLDKVDWPKETVKRQRDWIGRKEGINITYNIKGSEEKVTVFTTRPDTNFGATFIVISPEHPLVNKITTGEHKKEVEEYVKKAGRKTEIERTDATKEKTGVFTGSYAINQLTKYEMPIYVADYALMDYGTGAVVGVPGHDLRDYEFADKYKLKIIRVVVGPDGDKSPIIKKEQIQEEEGKMINSDFLNGMDIHKATEKIMDYIEKNGWGKRVVTYRLRDWSVSRQRFWGAPIPMLHRDLKESGKLEKLEELNEVYQRSPEIVVSVHAWASNSNEHYYPWLDKKLEKGGIEFINPDLPDTNEPELEKWMGTMEANLKGKDLTNAVVTGRSLGGWAALKLAEKYQMRKLILVAPSTPTPKGFETWREYAENDEVVAKLEKFIGGQQGNVDFTKVQENVGEIVMMHSIDDPYLSLEQSEAFLRKHLPFMRVVRFRDAGHFNTDHGFDKFPKLMEEITASVRLDLKPIAVNDLPVILPDDVDFKPTGESPLRYSPSFQKGVEEKYGQGFSREPDTLDTFMCSSWYYYRYLDPKNDKEFASTDALRKWMPVDFYLGGPEHVNGHLLYSRFFTKVLYDTGYIDFDEPFSVHRHQGLILGEDHRKMSKRWGNVINPTDVVKEFGADTLRMYEMFMGPLSDDKPWSTKGVVGVRRFLEKVWRLRDKVGHADPAKNDSSSDMQKEEINRLIKKIGDDLESLSFNTSIAKCMEFVNLLGKEDVVDKEVWEKFILVLAPFAPFIAEELWHELGNKDSVHVQKWPEFDRKLVEAKKDVTIAVQINGKVRGTVTVPQGTSEDVIKESVMKNENASKYLEGVEIKKVIFIQDKLISFVV